MVLPTGPPKARYTGASGTQNGILLRGRPPSSSPGCVGTCQLGITSNISETILMKLWIYEWGCDEKKINAPSERNSIIPGIVLGTSFTKGCWASNGVREQCL